MTDHLPAGGPLEDPAITTAPLDDPAVTSIPMEAPAPGQPVDDPNADPAADPAAPGMAAGDEHPASNAFGDAPDGPLLAGGGHDPGDPLDALGAGTEGPLDESGPPQGAGSW